MNSKERVRAAFEHKTPDRVPATMQAVETAWEKMQQYFQVESAEEVMDILEIDTRVMDFPPYIGPKKPDFVNAKGEVVHTHPLDSSMWKNGTVWSITAIPSKGLLNMLRQWKTSWPSETGPIPITLTMRL